MKALALLKIGILLALCGKTAQAQTVTIEGSFGVSQAQDTRFGVNESQVFLLSLLGYECVEIFWDEAAGIVRYICTLYVDGPPPTLTLQAGEFRTQLGLLNDNVGRIDKTDRRACLAVFEHARLQSGGGAGDQIFIQAAGTYDLADMDGFNRRASSIFFTDRVIRCAPSGVVRLHEHSRQRGLVVHLPYEFGVSNLGEFGFNDRVSSLTVPEDICVELFEDKNFGGQRLAYGPGTHGTLGGFNDRASSVRVSRSRTCS